MKNNTMRKCDLNKNLEHMIIYYKKWTMVLIILKYKNGKMFLDSENMTDNNFNAMIEAEDIDDTLPPIKIRVFDLGDKDCFNDENNVNCLSFIKILEPMTI